MQRENISDIIETYLKTILAQEAAMLKSDALKLLVVSIVYLHRSIM